VHAAQVDGQLPVDEDPDVVVTAEVEDLATLEREDVSELRSEAEVVAEAGEEAATE
jgi:hypothetical protein